MRGQTHLANRDYNVIFRDESGNATDAQLLAFEDTWQRICSVKDG